MLLSTMVLPLQHVIHRGCLSWRVFTTVSRSITTGASAQGSETHVEDESHCPVLRLDNMNPNVKLMEYAVRGPLVLRAKELQKELLHGKRKPFDEVIFANLGDGQAMGQIPVTFFREVLALVTFPPLMRDKRFASDAKARAKEILEACKGGSIGAYTDSQGLELVRRDAADYIERRDGGIKSRWKSILLGSGASDVIKSVLRLMLSGSKEKKRGVMVPIPQYPLYSATVVEFGMHLIGYYLDEANSWAINVDEMQRVYDESLEDCHPIALVIINPGNPTGQVLTRDNIKEIVKFAQRNKLFLLADEVYQDNVYADGCKFHSVKKVMYEMGPPYNKMELASFMSCSKGYMSECGLRGGYVELFNMVPEVLGMLHKSISVNLCPSVIGQVVMDCVVNPPRKGDVSYEQYACEKRVLLRSLSDRATLVTDTFNGIAGIKCNIVQGAMYAFPQLLLPARAVEKANELGIIADKMYASELLESTGICIVPGSGFGQKPGTYHIRTTILPQMKKLKIMLEKFREFHEMFLKKYQ